MCSSVPFTTLDILGVYNVINPFAELDILADPGIPWDLVPALRQKPDSESPLAPSLLPTHVKEICRKKLSIKTSLNISF